METNQRHFNRGSVSTGYEIETSVGIFGDNTDGQITQTGGDRKTHTVSFWHKRAPEGTQNDTGEGETGYSSNDLWGTASEGDTLRFNDDDLAFFHEGGTGSSLQTNRKFRDYSAWYHFVVAIDTTQGTASNRIKIYVNGVQETSFSTETYPDEDDEFKLMQSGQVFHIAAGHIGTTTINGLGYYADFIIVDGAAKAASDFGEFDEDSGIWKPKKYTGDFNTGSGTNGAHYKFAGTAEGTGAGSTGLDSSGESNNMNFRNQKGGLPDTPTNNFSTWQGGVLFNVAGDNPELYDGNTRLVRTSGTGWTTAYSSLAASGGKWYMEFLVPETDIQNAVGVVPVERTTQADRNNYYLGQTDDGTVGKHTDGGSVYRAGSGTSSTDISADDIIGVAMDLENSKVHFSVNNTWTNSSDPANNTNGFALTSGAAYMWGYSTYNPNKTDNKSNMGGYTSMTISSAENDANGYGDFEYAPPSGYYALCTKNLAEFGG